MELRYFKVRHLWLKFFSSIQVSGTCDLSHMLNSCTQLPVGHVRLKAARRARFAVYLNPTSILTSLGSLFCMSSQEEGHSPSIGTVLGEVVSSSEEMWPVAPCCLFHCCCFWCAPELHSLVSLPLSEPSPCIFSALKPGSPRVKYLSVSPR